ncbi:sulfatase-like hydrolase/transferase [Solirubrobacter sp. CPCC 204708]|uniref:Sulfatase-like hydrolase/transferase n=1 Tax=Solirubrobacter deserti TaxID=2282478 RepID=A0ABT4RG98_9ACTN|nr:sulfatase-like hydrolase/transferase [Solirubrobacter deserti]MBE2319695.1 sulfatase-like hydrolase/transferase [Solirubrobacter deserti]MDA0137565.1 sulfatase-like hydrolase/transferase [Solirubrobacter deserti]
MVPERGQHPFIGAYGDPFARTPNLDAFAREGVRYETAYATAPVCAPSRFSLITGKYAETCGPAHNMRAIAKMPASVRGFPEYLRAAGYYTTNNAKTDYNANIDLAATWNANGGTAHWRGRPTPETPFFAQFTSQLTHESQLFSTTPLTTDPATMRVPAFLPDTARTREDRARMYDNMARMDADFGRRMAELEADGLAESTIVFYFGDNGGMLPRSKRFANDFGLRVPLIVRIPARFQKLTGTRPGMVVRDPVSCVDLPATVLSLADVRVPDHMDGMPFLGRRSRPRRVIFGQRSRMDERVDLQRTARDERFVYIRNYMPHRPYGQNMGYMWQQRGYQDWEQAHLDGTVTPLQEAFWDEKPSEELYDIERDPDQLTNLVGHRRHEDELRRLRRALDDHILETNDNGFIPEGSPIEGHDESRAPGAYPLRQVMRLAETAIERDPRNLDELVGELDHPNEVMRYWAAQGILMLREAAQPAVVALRARLTAESSAAVQVVLAEALARLGHGGAPVKLLTDTADTHPNVRVRLLALNALVYVASRRFRTCR